MGNDAATDGIEPHAFADIDQEVVVTFRYPVRFTRGLFDMRNTTLRDVIQADDRARLLVVIDEGVADAHPDDGRRRAAVLRGRTPTRSSCRRRRSWCPAARRSRTTPARSTRSARRSTSTASTGTPTCVAIGGGAVLDTVGYAAATAHRGVRLIRVPTTVLAQDDSAVGVKNGINAFGKKNFVGSFAPPHAVLNDFDLLLTLQDRDWRAGISEAMKVALLKDAPFFAWIEHHAGDLDDRSLPAMAHLVHRSAELHLDHIATSGDPFELGSSRPLDFGHWAAHKLEQLSNHELRHGEAVAIGIALDSTYSYLTGSLPHADWRRIIALFEAVALPIWHPDLATPGSGGRPGGAGRPRGVP